MHYYKKNIPDWAMKTAHLSLEEEAVLLRLHHYYLSFEKPIPNNPEETQRVLRKLRLVNHEEVFYEILKEFFVLENDVWVNQECANLIGEFQKNGDRARENGRKGGRPKKKN